MKMNQSKERILQNNQILNNQHPLQNNQILNKNNQQLLNKPNLKNKENKKNKLTLTTLDPQTHLREEEEIQEVEEDNILPVLILNLIENFHHYLATLKLKPLNHTFIIIVTTNEALYIFNKIFEINLLFINK